jgi:glutamine amidotransferase
MCRLFGLHAGAAPIDAEFWLLGAPDNLEAQSRRNSDGFGIGTYSPDGEPIVDKTPMPAWRGPDFRAGRSPAPRPPSRGALGTSRSCRSTSS